MRTLLGPSFGRFLLLPVALTCVATALPVAAHAQNVLLTHEDSVVARERERQRDFERFRESRTPVQTFRGVQSCDEMIGTTCIWFGGEEEERYPRELPEVGQARVDLIRNLTDALEVAPHRWLKGQQVHYLVENGNPEEAQRVAEECGIEETWWCAALRGYALHLRGQFVDAESAFRQALATMPASEYPRWLSFRYIVPREEVEELDAGGTESWELFWRLSDPLFLVDGNDRLTDHFARIVQTINYEDGGNPYSDDWNAFDEESIIRYGRIRGYSRRHDPGRAFEYGGLNDTRRMIGHHHPKSRGYLFPHQFAESPSDIPPESWITAPREARTWYAPPYTPEMRGLETQVGRFRRGDEMLVVGAYRPTVADLRDPDSVLPWEPDGGARGSVHAAFFLQPETAAERPEYRRSTDVEGVFTIQTSPGRYVSSLEVVDVEGRQAWRARQGVKQLPMVQGLADVSDLVILREGAPSPESLEDAIPHVRPGVRVSTGERFTVVWEVYGLRILENVRVTVGLTEGLPDFLAPVGDFVEEIETDRPVEITFEDTGPDQVQSVFRSLEIELPDLDPGDYTLHLRLDLSGRTPIYASRPITVER